MKGCQKIENINCKRIVFLCGRLGYGATLALIPCRGKWKNEGKMRVLCFYGFALTYRKCLFMNELYR